MNIHSHKTFAQFSPHGESRLIAFEGNFDHAAQPHVLKFNENQEAIKRGLLRDPCYGQYMGIYNNALLRAEQGVKQGRYSPAFPQAIRDSAKMDQGIAAVEHALDQYWKRMTPENEYAYRVARHQLFIGAQHAESLVQKEEKTISRIDKDLQPRLKRYNGMMAEARAAVAEGRADQSLIRDMEEKAQFHTHVAKIKQSLEAIDFAVGGINGYHQNRGPVENAYKNWNIEWQSFYAGLNEAQALMHNHITKKEQRKLAAEQMKKDALKKEREDREFEEKRAKDKLEQQNRVDTFKENVVANEKGGSIENMPGLFVAIANNQLKISYDKGGEFVYGLPAGVVPNIDYNQLLGNVFIVIPDQKFGASTITVERRYVQDGDEYLIKETHPAGKGVPNREVILKKDQ